MTQRVIVTGGATGIGRAISQRFVRDGASVILVGRRAEVLEKTATDLRAMSGAEVRTASADLRSPEAVAGLVYDISGAGRVDALVLNAGGNFGKDADAADPAQQLTQVADAYRADFDGNVLPTVLLGEALLPHMTRPGGRVVAIGSVAGLRGSGSYGVAKAAVHAWVWDASMRVAAEGVTVNAVAPGYVPDTEFWTERLQQDPGLEANRLARIPLGRAGTPQEIAEAVAYFTSGGAGWTTGQILQVNGGTLLGHG
jgi:3-oxoacyl-[acyl-carrier protein] reductase